jgi:cation diffusion facilitator family transporter
LLAGGKIAIGAIFGFISVLADGLNNLSDCGSSLISYVSFKLSSRPADKEHPYGHERIEYISSMIISFIILIIAFELAKESISKILSPEKLDFSIVVVIILIVSILVKLSTFIFYSSVAKKINSDILKATALDSISDCISTTAVLISVIVGKLFNLNIDGYISILVSLLIAWSGIKILMESSSKLIGQAPEEEIIESIKQRVLSHKEVLGIHDLNVYSYGPNKYFASIHIELDAETDVLTSHEFIDDIEREFANETNILLTGHHDPIVINDPEVNMMREKVDKIVKNINSSFSTHDFRMVKGKNTTNIIFDIAVPFENELKSHEIIEIVKAEIAKIDTKYNPVIIVEKDLFK